MSSNSSHAYKARGVLTVGASRKRKETQHGYDAFNNNKASKSASTSASASASASTSTATILTPSDRNKVGPMVNNSVSNNRLLAGYLAHEFLTKGTLLGQKWDPARAESAPVSSRSNNNNNNARSRGAGEKKAVAGVGKESYAEVAKLIKSDGAHLPGIVNPTQLARWLQM